MLKKKRKISYYSSDPVQILNQIRSFHITDPNPYQNVAGMHHGIAVQLYSINALDIFMEKMLNPTTKIVKTSNFRSMKNMNYCVTFIQRYIKLI